MDNASFHHLGQIDQICREAGVKPVYLPPYSPNLNLIEEFFAELKAYIKRNWVLYQEVPKQGFRNFLEICVEAVGSKQQSARGHFRNSCVTITET
jgi:transposase